MIPTPKPYPARPEQCIVFYIRGSEYTDRVADNFRMHKPRLVMTGQNTGLLHRYSASEEFLMVQAVFYPGVLHRITGIPFIELLNGFIDLEDIFPKQGREVMDKLVNTLDYSEIISIIDDFINTISGNMKVEERPIDNVFRHILETPTLNSMDWYAKEACLSHRQFERKAQDYLGVSPKLFARISRFIRSFDMRQDNPDMDWLTIAIHCGYHDYQHLIRDYTMLANYRPNSLLHAESLSLERQLGLLKK